MIYILKKGDKTMREIITYVAYDDTEFDNREECEEYENTAFNLLEEIFNTYEFFLDNGQEIHIFLNDIEAGMYVFDYAWKKSKSIRVKRTLSDTANEFIYINFGHDMPPNELGLYEYNFKKCCWVKVDE